MNYSHPNRPEQKFVSILFRVPTQLAQQSRAWLSNEKVPKLSSKSVNLYYY